MSLVKETWFDLTQSFALDNKISEKLYLEIEKRYSEKHRYYHTLEHLNSLIELVNTYKDKVVNRPYVLFSLYYHDIVYNTLKSNNEEKSADLAKKRLNTFIENKELVNSVDKLIIATKKHIVADDINNFDSLFFLDCDLAILGSNRERYITYTEQIRNEYKIYPDIMYKKGRIKVLEHFLQMDSIYKTPEIKQKFENQAIDNMKYELSILNS